MKDLIMANLQPIIVAIISAIILYNPQLWYAYLMDYIVCCYALNAVITIIMRILKKYYD